MSKKKPSSTGAASGRKAPILVPDRFLESGRSRPTEDRAKLIQDLADLLRKNNLSELEFEREGRTVTYVARRRGIEEREVVLGPSNANFVVVEKGLEPGEQVCLRDPATLTAEEQ